MNNVWLFIPNLIGYLRLLLLAIAIWSDDPFQQALLLTSCCLLDIADGKAARLFNQTSLFGSRLDLIADLACHLLMAYYAFFAFSSTWGKGLVLFTALNDTVQYILILFTFYRRETGFDHKKELVRHGFLLPLYYSKAGLAISNVLNDTFLILTIFKPVLLTSYILYPCLAGFLFRHICVADQTRKIFALRDCQRII